MSDVAAVVGGAGAGRLPEHFLEDVEKWGESVHYKTHDVALICAGAGPWWVLCLDCEWSEDLPDDLLDDAGVDP